MPTNFTLAERLTLLNTLGIGRGSAISARDLALRLGYPVGGNQVKLRGLIKECIEDDGDLIGASTGRPAGFFKIETLNELERYIDSLENRTRSDNTRRNALLENWHRNPANTISNRTILTIE